MNPPILITGCARSGTSLVAGIINMCGAFGGNMSGPNKNNAKGMFENAFIRNHITKPYLTGLGVDPLGQFPLPDVNDLDIPPEWKAHVEDVMIKEGYKDGPWMYKGAKMCLKWPVWDFSFPDAKWVIVRRKTPDIINSCMKTGFMTAYATKRAQNAVNVEDEYNGWLWWVHQHEDRFREMKREGLSVMEVWPERMVDGDYGQIKEMLTWLGLEWTVEVMEFIEPKLWKSRKLKK